MTKNPKNQKTAKHSKKGFGGATFNLIKYMLVAIAIIIAIIALIFGESKMILTQNAEAPVTFTILNYEIIPEVEEGETPVSDYAYSLAQAVNKAPSGSTIKVLVGIEERTMIEIPASKEITLDLNGKTTEYSFNNFFIVNSGDLCIIDSSATEENTVGNGKIVKNNSADELYMMKCTETGNITIEGGELSGLNDYGVYNVGLGNIKVDGGKINVKMHAIRNVSTGKIEVASGEVISAQGDAIYMSANGKVTVSDGSIKGYTNEIVCTEKGEVAVTGGEIEATNGNGIKMYSTSGSNTGASLVIGKDDQEVVYNNPVIKGSKFGVNVDVPTFNFYDGIVKGPINKSISREPDAKPQNHVVVIGSEIIEDVKYETAYLQPIIPNVIINTESMYVPGAQVRVDGVHNYKDNNKEGKNYEATTWADLSGNNNNGAVTLGNGKWGENYLKFDGTNTWVNLGQMDHTMQTLEVTFSVDEIKSYDQHIISNTEMGGGAIYVGKNTGLIIGSFYINGDYREVYSGAVAQPNEIYHVVVNYDGNDVKLFINGEYVNSYANSEAIMNKEIGAPAESNGNSTVICLGANPAGNTASSGFFKGKIYSAAVYNRALSEEEIIQNSTAGLALAGGPVAANNVTYTVRFPDAVTGFDTNDIELTNGTKGTFTTVEAGKVYTLDAQVTTNSTTNTGIIQKVTVPEGAATVTSTNAQTIEANKTVEFIPSYQNTTTNAYFFTLKDAFAAAQTGETIKVLNNTQEYQQATLQTGTEANPVKLDLNGKIIDYKGTNTSCIENSGNLEIKDTAVPAGNTVGTGKITTASIINHKCLVENKTITSNFTLTSGKLETRTGSVANVISNIGKNLIINGGEIYQSCTGDSAIYNGGEGVANLFVNGGTITSKGYGIYMYNGKVEVNGGKIETMTTASRPAITISSNDTSQNPVVKITGGEVTSDSSNAIVVNKGDSLIYIQKVTGRTPPTISSTGSNVIDTSGSINMECGTVNAYSGAGILAGGEINITGGTVRKSINPKTNQWVGDACIVYGGTQTAIIAGDAVIQNDAGNGSNVIYNAGTGTMEISENATVQNLGAVLTGTNYGTGKIVVKGNAKVTSNGGDVLVNYGSTGCIEVQGGEVSTSGTSAAINSSGANSTVKVTGGKVSTQGVSAIITASQGDSTNHVAVTIGTQGSSSTTTPEVIGQIYSNTSGVGEIVVNSGKVIGTPTTHSKAIYTTGNVTVNGGYLEANSKVTDDWAYTIIAMSNNSKINITGGTIVNDNNVAVCVSGNATGAEINISGGTIISRAALAVMNKKGSINVTNNPTIIGKAQALRTDSGTITVKGGTIIGGRNLPNSYQEVECIQATGSQYIDTGYYWTSEDVEIYFDGTLVTNESDQSAFGNEEYNSESGSSKNFAGALYRASEQNHIFIGNGSQGTIPVTIGDRFKLDIVATKDKQLRVVKDGTTVINKTFTGSVKTKDAAYLSSNVSTTVGNIFLFGNHNSQRGSGNSAYQAKGTRRVYAFRLFDDGVLVRDLVPCYRKSDNVVGMYDMVNGNFYTNAGTGEFTYVEIGTTAADGYGVLGLNNTSTMTIGDNTDSTVGSTTSPVIKGAYRGVSTNGGTFNFYDGQITGQTGKSVSKEPDNIPTGYTRRVTNNNDGTETSTIDNHYNVQFLSENLLEGKTLFENGITSGSQANGAYTGTLTSTTSGWGIDASNFTVNKKYLLRYKVKKTAGTLRNIAGHASAAQQEKFSIDGVDSTTVYHTSSASYVSNILDDTNEHIVEFKFTYKGDTSGAIYIQPNRGTSDSVTLNLYDVELYEIVQESTKTYGQTYGTLPTAPAKTGYTAIWTRNLADVISENNYILYNYSDRTPLEIKNDGQFDGLTNQPYVHINGNSSSTNIDTVWRITGNNSFTVTAGNKYVLSFYVRSKNAVATQNVYRHEEGLNDGFTNIEWSNGAKSYLTNNIEFSNDGEWHLVQTEFTAPAGVRSGKIIIGNDMPNLYGTGSYFDVAGIQFSEGTTVSRVVIGADKTIPMEDHRVYAKYVPNNYTLTLNPNGGTYKGTTSNSTVTATYGTDVNLGMPTRTGYTFKQWKTSDSQIYDKNLLTGTEAPEFKSPSTNAAGNWRGASSGTGSRSYLNISDPPVEGITRGFSIVGDGTATDFAQDSVPVTIGKKYTLSIWARGTGSVYFEVGNSSWAGNNTVINNVTTWTKYSWTFTAGTDGSATNNVTNIYFGNHGTGTVELCGMKMEEETGFSDLLWSKVPSTTTAPTLVAEWTPNTYTLTLNPNGGTYKGTTSNSTVSATYETDVNLGIPTRAGYIFKQWKTSDSQIFDKNILTGAYSPELKSPASNANAGWRSASDGGPRTIINITNPPEEGITKGFEITGSKDSNGRTLGLDVAQDLVPVTLGKTYTFSVWAKGSGGLNLQHGRNSFGTQYYELNNVTQWTKYTYTFIAQNGYVVDGATNIYVGNRGGYGTLQICGMKLEENTGFKDLLWSKVPSTTTAPTLVAEWTPMALKINPNGGTFNGTTGITTVNYPGTPTYSVANNPTKAGYIFIGWTLSGDGSLQYYDTSSTPTTTTTKNYNSASSELPNAYNNTGSNTTRAMVADSTATGGYSLKVTTNGAASPGAGGVHLPIWDTTAGRVNVLEVRAKIPTGYNIYLAGIDNRYTGTGSAFICDDGAGTGDWKTYYLIVYQGDTGTLTPTAYIYISGSNNTSVSWNIDSITMKSFTKDQFKSLYTFGTGLGNRTLTANWNAGGARVWFYSNGGTFNTTYVKDWYNGYNGASSTGAGRYYRYNMAYATAPASSDYNWTPDTRVTTRSGYVLDGWYTAASGGTKIFNADGTLVKSVSGYSDSSGRWIKYDANVDVFAHWTKVCTVTLNQDGGSGGTTTIYEKYGVGWYSDAACTNAITSITIPSKSGYEFGGYFVEGYDTTWIDSAGVIKLSATATSIDNVTLKAKWNKIPTFIDGNEFNQKMLTLAGNDLSNINAITKTDSLPSQYKTSDNLVSTDASAPIYMWYDSRTIYWWSETGAVYANFDSSKMFKGCSSLETLDLSNFDTSSVENMGHMFYGCGSLYRIYASSSFDTRNVRYSNYMFSGCTNLVGGANTTYNASYIDKTRAKIDGGTSDPGYFTAR